MGSVVTRFEVGACVVTVWANAVKRPEGEVVLHNVSVGRAYKDRDGHVQWTGSLRPQDVPAVMLALGRAYAYLLDLTAETTAGEERAA